VRPGSNLNCFDHFFRDKEFGCLDIWKSEMGLITEIVSVARISPQHSLRYPHLFSLPSFQFSALRRAPWFTWKNITHLKAGSITRLFALIGRAASGGAPEPPRAIWVGPEFYDFNSLLFSLSIKFPHFLRSDVSFVRNRTFWNRTRNQTLESNRTSDFGRLPNSDRTSQRDEPLDAEVQSDMRCLVETSDLKLIV